MKRLYLVAAAAAALLFGQAVLNLNNQLTNLSTELAIGQKSTTYSGVGVGETDRQKSRKSLGYGAGHPHWRNNHVDR